MMKHREADSKELERITKMQRQERNTEIQRQDFICKKVFVKYFT